MNWRVPFCCVLFGLINMLNVSTGAARLAGVYTKRIATALTLFNTFFLVSRMANLFMVPVIARLAEIARQTHDVRTLAMQYRLILGSAALGCCLAFLLIPTFVEVFKRGISGLERREALHLVLLGLFDPRRSRYLFLALLMAVLSGGGTAAFLAHRGFFHFSSGSSLALIAVVFSALIYFALGSLFWIFHPGVFRPTYKLGSLVRLSEIPRDFLVLNVISQAFWTVGWMSAVYAGAVHAQRDITSVSLSGTITGVSTVLFSFFVDPKVALMTDQSAHGIKSEAHMRTVVLYLTITAILGTLVAQLIFEPAANVIAFVAAHI